MTRDVKKEHENIHQEQIIKDLALICASADTTRLKDQELALLARDCALDVDWLRAIEVMEYHGLSSILHSMIHSIDDDSKIPVLVRQRLKKVSQDRVLTGQAQELVLIEVLRLFERENITAIALKGNALEDEVYPTRGLRFSGDIDMLLHPNDIQKAQELLEGIRYKHRPGGLRHDLIEKIVTLPVLRSRLQIGGTWRNRFPLLFAQPRTTQVFDGISGCTIELHEYLSCSKRYEQSTNIEIQEIWEEARMRQGFDGVRLLCMRPEHLLIYLCLHQFVQHGFRIKLIWIRDLRQVLERYKQSLDWGYFVYSVKKWGVKTYTYFPLVIAQKYTGAVIPAEVIEEIRPRYLTARFLEKKLDATDLLTNHRRNKRSIHYLSMIVADRRVYRLWAFLTLPFAQAMQFIRGRRMWRSIKEQLTKKLLRWGITAKDPVNS